MKTALVVIDMQNDYLYEQRKKKFTYNTEQLVSSVNDIIHTYAEKNCDVIYIRHIIQNLPTNRLLFGYSIAGTEGAEIYKGVEVISDYCFDKLFGDALSNKQLRNFIQSKGYDVLHLCGLDECGCVASTAFGAAKRGIRVEILRAGVATIFPKRKADKIHQKLNKAGIKLI